MTETKYPTCEAYAKVSDFTQMLGEVIEAGFVILDKDGRDVCNPEAVTCEMFGIDRTELERERRDILQSCISNNQ